ncbi:MAG: YbhB/YbcL family Raf kinase inhibitor-like protein [Candidatus Saccharimonadales bacterium]
MQLTSPTFEPNQQIPEIYTCKGANYSPPFTIENVPSEAKSLALIMHDPTAPGGDFVHWTMWNIDPQTPQIAEGTTPDRAVEGVTNFGPPGYGGPCPPKGSGTHQYVFELYALNVEELDLPVTTTAAELTGSMQEYVVDTAQLTGLFSAEA